MGVSDIDGCGGLDDRAGEEVGHHHVGQQNMVGGGRDVGEILESDQEEIVEESSHAGEAHLGQDQGGRTEDVHVSRIFH